jgi:hypothetical protein
MIQIANCEKMGYHFSFSQPTFRFSPFAILFFAFRNFSIGGCPKNHGQAQGPAPTKDFSIPKSEFQTPNS